MGTALGHESRVWFTIGEGILNEVYFPRVDQACVRDLGLIVTDGAGFFSEEKRDTHHEVRWLAEGVPALRVINTCRAGRYLIEKEILTDPRRDVLLQAIRFVPRAGRSADYHLYALLAPHLENHGAGNTAWVDEYKGVPMLFATRGATALALASSAPWLRRSVGFVGTSDGWQDLSRHGVLTWDYTRAEDGNVAMVGEVDRDELVLALAFGRNAAEAGHRARASLLDGFQAARTEYLRGWQAWQSGLLELDETPGLTAERRPGRRSPYRVSTAVLRTHEALEFPGGLIASLSIPWGASRGDRDLGGYHLTWPRDLVQAASGFLAAGAQEDARRILHYLEVTQEADGHWAQNMWLDGLPYWNGIQMDETALPILLRRAAGYIVTNGPVSPQDRWEEDPGYSPFTVGAEIAALLVAADLAEGHGEATVAHYLRETADGWYSSIDRWLYVTGTEPCRELSVPGYYARIAQVEHGHPSQVSPDALALVRFGVRRADDPRITDTVRVIDARLRVDTPYGPAWRRYASDRYGEHDDGTPYGDEDGAGRGRAWPLLTGERAHYELAAGHVRDAERLRVALERLAGDDGLLPEQVWDSADVPRRALFLGRPSGSARPLVWAHAEYLGLLRSLLDGRVFDRPFETVTRYLKHRVEAGHVSWRFSHKLRSVPAGKTLRVEVMAPAVVRWSADGWRTSADLGTRDTGLGVWVADLATRTLPVGACIAFTFRWPEVDRWEGTDFAVSVDPAEPRSLPFGRPDEDQRLRRTAL